MNRLTRIPRLIRRSILGAIVLQASLTAGAQTAAIGADIGADEARRIVAPFYDALNQPATKNVDELLGRATTADWQSCGGNAACAPREVVIGAFKRRGADVPDLHWEIKDLRMAGPDTVIVRGEASGTPVREFFGLAPTGKSFRVMSIDVHTLRDSRMQRSYHVEDWAGALRQLAAKP